jgi:hypothetical protein
MLDFNDIGIKGPDDLQEALQVKMSPESFKMQFMWMVDRWGLEDSLDMLAVALVGDAHGDIKGLIEPTKHFVAYNPKDPGTDYYLEDIESTGKK